MTALFTGTGAMCAFLGVGIGMRLPRTRPGICPCGHPYGCRDSFGTCSRKIRVRAYTSGRRAGWKYEACKCRDHVPPGLSAAEPHDPDYVTEGSGAR